MYTPTIRAQGNTWESKISVDGMKCYACVNKIKQQIYKRFPNSRVDADFANKSFTLRFKEKPDNLNLITEGIAQLGFKTRAYYNKAFREELIFLGVAGYAAGNVMLMSIAEYIGTIDAPFDTLLRYISLCLTSYSIIFAAKPIWQSALSGLRCKKFEVDLGILLGVVGAYTFSCWNVLHEGEVYFDSVALVIFLILSGRFIRNRKLEQASQDLSEPMSSDPEFTYLLEGSEPKIIHTSSLKSGDKILVRPGDMIPVESIVESGTGYVDYSSINGESERQLIKEGISLPSGAFSIDGAFSLRCLADGKSGFFNRSKVIMDELLYKKGEWQNKANFVAKWFVYALAFSVLTIILFKVGGSYQESVRRSIALLLVACPCALGFGIPLVLSRAINELSENGVIVQNVQALERILQCKDVVFDKTGTLTTPSLELKQVKIHNQTVNIHRLARAIGHYSQHHVTQALAQWALKDKRSLVDPLKVNDVRETPGKGLLLTGSEGIIKLGKPSFTCGVCSHIGDVHLNIDGACIMSFELGESLADAVESTFEFFRKRNKRLYILSGDVKKRTIKLADNLGIDEAKILSQQSPEDKLNFALNKKFLMVGNGLNDMMAFSASRVSIAVKGSQPLARNKADFFLNNASLDGVAKVYRVGEQLNLVLKKLYTFSFIYNACTLLGASMGLVNPLVAAILMPLSSLGTIKLASTWPKGS